MDAIVYSRESIVMPPPPEFEQAEDDQIVPAQYIEKGGCSHIVIFLLAIATNFFIATLYNHSCMKSKYTAQEA